MNGEAFLRAFPMVQTDFSTGGGCMAWNLTLSGKCYLLITDATDGGYQPEKDADKAAFGV